MSSIHVRLAALDDLPRYHEHLTRHGMESGRDGDLVFAPYEEPWNRPLESLRKEKEEKWKRPLTEIGWERCWIITDGTAIYGDLKLAHAIGLKTSLHRAILMMGIERSHRSKGFGSQLMQTALDWARNQTSLSWIQLNVFDHNQPAKQLYRRFGFQEAGTNQDLFRLNGQSINDTEMVLNISGNPKTEQSEEASDRIEFNEIRGLDNVLMFVKDVGQSKAWYSKVFGLSPSFEIPNFAEFRIGQHALGLHPADEKSPLTTGGQVAYWAVDNFENAVERFVSHGGQVYRGPLDIEDGRTICQILDPFGNAIGLIGKRKGL